MMTLWLLGAMLLAAGLAGAEERITPKQEKLADPPMELLSGAKQLTIRQVGPFVNLPDGGLLCVKDGSTLVSRNSGVTWQAGRMFGDRDMSARPEQALIRTKDGTIVLVYMDDRDKRWKWSDEKNNVDGEARLFVWSARSTDNGKTWTDIRRIQDGYCGAIRDIIETSRGDLVVPVQKFLPDKARHVTIPHFSSDGGRTWTSTRVLDVGGRGHHDGAMEGTLVELRDKRLWLLLRTNLDALYESFSADGGRTWSDPAKTGIGASSAPAMVKRLDSGRLILLWNRLGPADGGEAGERVAGQHSAAYASWFRAELSLAFSEDDGKTWTTPVVIARKPGKWVSYPYVLERSPGELWVTTMQGGLEARLSEADYVPAKK